MTLARMWGRQLCLASSAALIVPSAMIAALVALALGGGFSQLGVLGQVFSGPPAPSAGPLTASGNAARTTSGSIPTIPVVQVVATRPMSGADGARGRPAPSPRTGAPSKGLGSTGGTIAPGGVTTRPISQAPAPASPPPGPVASSPSPLPPAPVPSPHPTPVDPVVKVVTSVTSQLPAPAGPAVTQSVQSVGSAADNLVQSLP